MKSIYISHVEDDSQFVRTLIDRLREARLTDWIDGSQLRTAEQVEAALRQTSALVVVMTPEAKASEQVTYEWSFALGLGVMVIPVILRPVDLHPRLERLSGFDFTNGTAAWPTLIETLGAAVRNHLEQRLVEALRDENWQTRVVAANMLGDMGYSAAVPELAQALSDDYLEVREAALDALGDIGDPAAVPVLIDFLPVRSTELRIAAIYALGKIASALSVNPLVGALSDEHTAVRWTAAWALGQIGAAAVPELIEALSNPDSRVRATAAGALAKVGVGDNIDLTAAVPGLVKALGDEKWNVREAAARVLAQLHQPAAVPGLLVALGDRDARVRGTAASALGEIGLPAAPGLIGILDDPDVELRRVAAGILGIVAMRSPLPELLDALGSALQQDNDAGVRKAAVWALRSTRSELAVPWLARALRDENEGIRQDALKALYAIGTPEAIEAAKRWIE